MDEACHFRLFLAFIVSAKMSKFAKWKHEVISHFHIFDMRKYWESQSQIFFWGGFYYGYPKLISTWVMNLLYIGRPYTKGHNANLQTKKRLFIYVFSGGIMCLQNCNNFTTSRSEICEILYCHIYVMPWDHRGRHLKLLNLRNLGFLIVILLDWHIGDKFSQSRWQAMIHSAASWRQNLWAIAWAPSFSAPYFMVSYTSTC